MASPALSFVTGPNATPTVTLALNPDDSNYVDAENFSLGAPVFEAAPDSVGGVDGFRTVSFTVVVRGSWSVAAAAMQNVARHLLQPRNWLMLSPSSPAKPMFLQTYRTQQEALAWDDADLGVWTLPVSLAADAYLLGDRVDLASHTVANAVSGTDMVQSVSGVKGDAPTPAVIWTPDVDAAEQVLIVGSTTQPAVVEAESMTLAFGTSLVSADTTFSNSGGVVTSAGGNTTQVSAPLPSNVTGGTYQLWLRLKKSSTSSVWSGSVSGITGFANDVLNFPTLGTTEFQMVNMGTVEIPERQVGYADPLAPALPTFTFSSTRTSGTGTLSVDYFVFIPVDDETTTAVVTVPSVTPTPPLVLDARQNQAYYAPSTGSPFIAAARASAIAGFTQDGALPSMVPGVTNYLTYLRLGAVPLTKTSVLNVSYWPRYLHLRPDAT